MSGLDYFSIHAYRPHALSFTSVAFVLGAFPRQTYDNMDVTLLRNRIQSTVDPNADARRQAELDLRYVSSLTLLLTKCTNLRT